MALLRAQRLLGFCVRLAPGRNRLPARALRSAHAGPSESHVGQQRRSFSPKKQGTSMMPPTPSNAGTPRRPLALKWGDVSQRDSGNDAKAVTELKKYNSDVKDLAVLQGSEYKFHSDVPQEVVEFWNVRRISPRTLFENKVGWRACLQRGDKEAMQGPIIAYRYYHHDELVNIKFRHVREKKFYSVPLQQKALYGLDHVHAAFVCSCGCKTEPAKNGQWPACSCTKQVIIVEGEMDKLALYEAGVHNVVSVPNGAAGAAAKPRQQEAGGAVAKEAPPPATEDEDTNRGFSYIWAAKDLLKEATQVVIATDNDVAGQALSEELARRLGRERCWLVDFGNAGPDGEGGDDAQAGESPSHSCKDANEVLMKLGAEGLVETIQSATQYPIQGIKTFRDFYHEILAFYRMEPGDDNFGLSSGWATLDEYYKVVPGELTIVTGVPNSGKSEWIDALAMNLATNNGWRFAMCSMENRVRDHFRKLSEKHIGRPFFKQPGSPAARMSFDDLGVAMRFLDERFVLLRHEHDQVPDIDWVLSRAREAVMRYGIRGLVIDPYNELEHQRDHGRATETEYVSNMLSKVKRFAQLHSVHVWFVAHPRQLHNWRDEVPSLYDIAGSAHFVNKADNGIVVHRYRSAENAARKDEVEIHMLKVRNKLAGKLGVLSLDYRVADGTYSDKPDNLERLKLQQEAERRQQSEERWSHAVSEGAEAGGEQPLQQSSSPAAAGKQLRSNAQRPPVAGR